MADSSSTPPPTFIGYPIYYSAATRAPAYGMGSRGELVATVSSGPPENVVSWTTVAEPGHWFYVSPPPGQCGGTIMINSAAVANGVTGSIVTQSASKCTGTGTGVFLPEPRSRRMQQPAPLVPERVVSPPTEAGGKDWNSTLETSVTDRSPSRRPATKTSPNHPGQRRKEKEEAMAVTVMEASEKEKATTPTVDDISELALLPEEWVY